MFLRYLSCFGLILLMSCEPELKQLDSDLLIGNWEMVYAERDGRRTRMLNGAYMSFRDSSTLESNILGDTILYAYGVVGNQITQTGATDMIYDIRNLSKDTLILNTQIRNSKFIFHLLKQ